MIRLHLLSPNTRDSGNTSTNERVSECSISMITSPLPSFVAHGEQPTLRLPAPSSDRREFLRRAAIVLVALPITGCAVTTGGIGRGIDLGAGDIGIMNYALVLESLETEFYTVALNRPYAGMPQSESELLRNTRDVELVHREFFRRALGANAIPPPKFDFSRINFNNRRAVLTAGHTFEDTGVAAYNGAGNAIRNPRILEVAGKIVSVEARHAAMLRELLYPGTGVFAPTPLDAADGPRAILRKVDPYLITKVNGNRLPDA